MLYRDVTLLSQESAQKFRGTLNENQGLAKWSKSIWLGPLCFEGSNNSTIWERALLESILMDILPKVPHLKRLALINLPSWSTTAWSNIEPILPPKLECFAAGPDHAILVKPSAYPTLRWFCSIDTILTEAEFGVLLSMPNLLEFHWCFIRERIQLDSVRSLSNLLEDRMWNAVCLYIVDGSEMRPDEPEEVELELINIYEDKRVKRYHLLNVNDWSLPLFKHWTEDWVSSGWPHPLTHSVEQI